MKRYTAFIRHSYDTILRMCKTQYGINNFRNRMIIIVVGMLLAIVGLPIIGSLIGLLMVMIGCFMITSVDMPARMQADEIKKALDGKYPRNSYEFYDGHFVVIAQNQDIINYDRLIRLVEDEMYCYLWISKSASYMIEKYSLGKEADSFMAFMEKQTGKEWEKPQKLTGVNLGTIIRMFKGESATKKAKKK